MEIQKTHRRWFRFRLRTLLVMVTMISVSLGWVGWELDQRRRENATIAWVEKMGGHFNFCNSFVSLDQRNWREKTKDKWFGERVRDVFLYETKVIDPLPLKELKKLERLYLLGTELNGEKVEKLMLSLPHCRIILLD